MGKKGGGGGGGDKRGAFFAAIKSEKLDTVRYSLTHGALSIVIEDDDGHTPLVVAAAGGKHRSLEQMLQILQRQRALKDYIDIRDEEGRTPFMFAAANGYVACCDVLKEFGASPTLKCEKGLNARDYAVKRGKTKVVEWFDYKSEEEEDEGEEPAEDDGLTSTQRNKMKKKAKEDAENRGAAKKEETDTQVDEEELEAKEQAKEEAKKEAVWGELKALSHMEGKDIREVTLIKVEEEDCVAHGECGVDPALWRCDFLKTIKLQMPPEKLVALPDSLGNLTALDTLILSKNALRGLPETIGNLLALRVLEVDHNKLETVPASLGKLPKLETLNLANNSLSTLAPLADGSLPNLLTFAADFNQLQGLELPFASMARISSISVANNCIEALQEEMGLMQGSLTCLSLTANKITSLAAIRDLNPKKLKVLNVDENPFADKKVPKLLRGERPEQVIKELLKYLQKQGPDGGSGGGGKKKKK